MAAIIQGIVVNVNVLSSEFNACFLAVRGYDPRNRVYKAKAMRDVLKRLPRRGRAAMRLSRMRTGRRVPVGILKWFIFVIGASFAIFQFCLQLSSGDMVVGLMHSFSLTALGAGVLTSAYYYIYVALQMPVGMLIDRYGPRLLMSLGALACAIGTATFALSPWFALALIGRLLMGAGAAFAFVGTIALISRWFLARRFAILVGVLEAFGMLGTVLINILLAHVIEAYSWRKAMFWGAEIAVVIAILLWLIIRDSPRVTAPFSLPPKGRVARDLRQLLSNKRVWANGLFSGLMFSVMTVFGALWAIPFFMTEYHIGLTQAALLTNTMFVGIIFGGPFMGWLDGIVRHRRYIFLISAFCAMSVFMFALLMPGMSQWLVFALMLLLGFFCSSYVLTFKVGHELATPATRGASIGFVNTLSVGTAPLFQMVVGFLMDFFSSGNSDHVHYALLTYQKALLVIPLLLLIAVVCSLLIPSNPENKKQTTL